MYYRRVACILLAIVAVCLPTSASAQNFDSADSNPQWGVDASAQSDSTLAPWQCFGFAVGPQREQDTVGKYIFFGGRQQCTIIVSQTVDVYLERLIGGDWVAVAHVFKAGVGNILQGTGDSPYCSDTTTNTYHIEAFGTANGIHATPWPYVGPNVNLACRINAF